MIFRLPGTRQKTYKQWDNAKHQPYDYEKNGLLKKVLPAVIMNAKNPTTRIVLVGVEMCMVFLLKYVDELKHFKNYNHRLY